MSAPDTRPPDVVLWDAVATLLLYPTPSIAGELRSAAKAVAAAEEPLHGAGARYLRFLEATPPTELEERFTRTFDINPTCSLEAGWHLYGEDYKRGAFLVDMRALMRALGVEETAELPDHLVHMLRVLGRLASPKAAQLSTSYIQPALVKMLDGFPEDDAPWRTLLASLLETLERHYGQTEALPEVPTASEPPYAAAGCSPAPSDAPR